MSSKKKCLEGGDISGQFCAREDDTDCPVRLTATCRPPVDASTGRWRAAHGAREAAARVGADGAHRPLVRPDVHLPRPRDQLDACGGVGPDDVTQ